jgi:hypothetical protein
MIQKKTAIKIARQLQEFCEKWDGDNEGGYACYGCPFDGKQTEDGFWCRLEREAPTDWDLGKLKTLGKI